MSSTLNFAKIKDIDQFTKDTVYGFVHHHERELKKQAVPTAILSICLLFYHIKEHWTYHDDSIMLRDVNGDIITNISDESGTVYGHVIADNQIPSIYIWIIKILRLQQRVYLGVDSSNKEYINTVFRIKCLQNDVPFYAYSNGSKYDVNRDTHDGSLRKWKSGDMIKLELNTKQKTLTLYVNDIDQALGHKNINCDVNYHLAASMNDKHDALQIVNFQRIKQY